ncbi:hypothetical protein FGE12_04910 [Aggregicoccus sp. 17bor-14]|uniref:cobalamin B12-binding domain-containing protein n=1 Tax=Myxococcaceae TaxID=31 RepID=UPI00129CAABC|nr:MULTISPECIES: cobalamin-dependent protein [Myxococcaceae]MBF5041720.1 cobalamin-dependent protein [Simulacricoccus sp. 17bor-14]MRI87501.1 hypothetical protein [Aggregicoccus sp. 17bor-14]
MAMQQCQDLAGRLAGVRTRVVASATASASRGEPRLQAAGEAACSALLGVGTHALTLAVALDDPGLFEAHLRGLVPLLVRRGLGLEALRAALRELAAALRAELLPEDARQVLPALEGALARLSPPGDDPQRLLLQALLFGDLEGARALVQAGLPRGHLYVYSQLLQPALEEVGELWRTHRIGIADEHLATAVARAVVGSLYASFPWPRSGPRALVACVEGELHDFGVQLVADLLALHGWDVQSLGGNTPTRELVRWACEVHPAFVGLSVSSVAQLPAALRAARTLSEALPGVRLVLGGQVLRREPGLQPSDLGVHLLARDTTETLRALEAWRDEAPRWSGASASL